jgi:hypothetical protein
MEQCVASARRAGVFKEFHVLADRNLEGCETYDAFKFDAKHGLFKLDYLKVGMSRLNFDYFVWLDADTVFARNPVDVLGVLGKSPLHIPLETNLSTLAEDATWKEVSLYKLRDFMRAQGVANEVYWNRSAFWIAHHDLIEPLCELAIEFWKNARDASLLLDVSAALGYAMQILCAEPEGHLLLNRPDLWASADKETELHDQGWTRREAFTGREMSVRPAIVHLSADRWKLKSDSRLPTQSC